MIGALKLLAASNVMIMRILKVYRELDLAEQVKLQRAACGGNSLHRCCCFQRRNRELRDAN